MESEEDDAQVEDSRADDVENWLRRGPNYRGRRPSPQPGSPPAPQQQPFSPPRPPGARRRHLPALIVLVILLIALAALAVFLLTR